MKSGAARGVHPLDRGSHRAAANPIARDPGGQARG
jgi:hypothetical protein